MTYTKTFVCNHQSCPRRSKETWTLLLMFAGSFVLSSSVNMLFSDLILLCKIPNLLMRTEKQCSYLSDPSRIQDFAIWFPSDGSNRQMNKLWINFFFFTTPFLLMHRCCSVNKDGHKQKHLLLLSAQDSCQCLRKQLYVKNQFQWETQGQRTVLDICDSDPERKERGMGMSLGRERPLTVVRVDVYRRMYWQSMWCFFLDVPFWLLCAYMFVLTYPFLLVEMCISIFSS